MDIIRTLAASMFFAIVLAKENSTKWGGKLGHAVKLPCRIPSDLQHTRVRWEDTVHTSSPQPILLFDSQNNPGFVINSDHPYSANYVVDRTKFDLKILSLTFEDVGTYSCISESATSTHRQDYYLSIQGALECSGKTQLRQEDPTTLRCEVMYGGEQPSLDWFRADHRLDSIDRSGIEDSLFAAKELKLNATHDLDGETFQCQMDLANKHDQCKLLLNVVYPVRDVGFKSGEKKSFYVGEEVTCVARGNPAPEISLVPTSLPERADDRKKSSIIIPNSWVGKEVNLECTATNTYQGKEQVERKSISIHVLEPTTTTPTTTTTRKPKMTPKPAVDGAGSLGEGLAGWKRFPLIVLSVTLMKLIAFSC